MTRREREQLKKAIARFMSDEDHGFEDGMRIISKLVSPEWQHPLGEIRITVGLTEVFAQTRAAAEKEQR